MIPKNILKFLILFFTISSCTSDKLDVDTKNIQVDIAYINLDSMLINSDSLALMNLHHKMQKQIPDAYEYMLGYCLQIRNLEDSVFFETISKFKKDPYIARLEKSIAKSFSSTKEIEKNINEGFRHLKYHFPKGKQPENIVFINSLFAANASSFENDIAIGLERYLSKQNEVIKELPAQTFFEWIKDGFNDDYIERDVICSWILTHYLEEKEGNLAENIVRWGKILYLTKACMPHKEDYTILRYDKKDYKWAKENEYSFWKYLIKQNMLYKIDDRNKANMLNEGPFTIGLPEKGPDRLGQYLGYQMVLQFMDDNEISLEKLLKVPYNKIITNYEVE